MSRLWVGFIRHTLGGFIAFLGTSIAGFSQSVTACRTYAFSPNATNPLLRGKAPAGLASGS